MPYGIIADIITIFIGGLVGGLIGKRLPERYREELNSIIGVWAFTLGIALIPKIQSFGAVMLALVFSYTIGYALDFDGHVNRVVLKASKRIFGSSDIDVDTLSVLIVLASFGGSGVVGAMTEAISGDRSIILGRAAADLFTAALFGAKVGSVACITSVPMTFTLFGYYFCAKLIMPLMTDVVYANFIAAGGVLTLASAVRLFGVSKAKPMNAVLVVFLIVPISILWQNIFG